MVWIKMATNTMDFVQKTAPNMLIYQVKGLLFFQNSINLMTFNSSLQDKIYKIYTGQKMCFSLHI